MNDAKPLAASSRSADFLGRIVSNQSNKRRVTNEAVGRVLAAYLPTVYEKLLNEQIDWLLDSMLLELGEQPGVAPTNGMVRGGRALVVTGKAGAGKSRALAHAFATRPEFEGFGTPGSWCPLLSVVAPSPFTLGALGNEIARKLGYHGHREIQHSKVWPVVRGLMAECGVRILHIDEAQHGDEIRSDVMAQEVENTFKRMMQEADWPIWLILSGWGRYRAARSPGNPRGSSITFSGACVTPRSIHGWTACPSMRRCTSHLWRVRLLFTGRA